jgi:hypothetical protein
VSRDARKHFGTIYITLASVLLGLALGDLVSIVRSSDYRDPFVWVTSIFVVHIIMNAWIAYSSTAIIVAIEPHPWDALNVFALSAAHFAINSFVGPDAAPFLAAVGVYSLTAAATVFAAKLRVRRDPDFELPPAAFRPVIALNIGAGVYFLSLAAVSGAAGASRTLKLLFVASSLPYASAWLFLFWKSWTAVRSNFREHEA